VTRANNVAHMRTEGTDEYKRCMKAAASEKLGASRTSVPRQAAEISVGPSPPTTNGGVAFGHCNERLLAREMPQSGNGTDVDALSAAVSELVSTNKTIIQRLDAYTEQNQRILTAILMRGLPQ
jgi:hypothetical protein